MISFRYHLVSIVAVFLALGLGILMGTTVVKQSLLDELRRRADSAIATTHRLQADVAELRTEVRRMDEFGRAAEGLLIEGRLDGEEAVLVTAEDVDVSEVDGVRRALADAGATVGAVLVVTDRMKLHREPDREKLADILGLGITPAAEELARQAAARLGERLADGSAGTGDLDLLEELMAGGFLAGRVTATPGLGGVGGPDQPVVVLSGGATPPLVPPEAFFLPLLVSLAEDGHPAVAGETEETAYELVTLVRDDATLGGQVLTVDNADSTAGRVALVLGLDSLLEPSIVPCRAFGVKRGTCGLLPAPAPSP